jgi:hypothetical protein
MSCAVAKHCNAISRTRNRGRQPERGFGPSWRDRESRKLTPRKIVHFLSGCQVFFFKSLIFFWQHAGHNLEDSSQSAVAVGVENNFSIRCCRFAMLGVSCKVAVTAVADLTGVLESEFQWEEASRSEPVLLSGYQLASGAASGFHLQSRSVLACQSESALACKLRLPSQWA